MKSTTKLALAAIIMVLVLGMAFWLRRPAASPLVGLWIDATGEQIRFRSDGSFSMVYDQPLVGNLLPLRRDEQYMQGRYTFLDSTHIRTEFTHKLGSSRVFMFTPSGSLVWPNLRGEAFTYEKRRLSL